MKKAYFKYIFAMLLFGSNGVVASNIKLTSYEIVLWRTIIGSLLLIALFFLTKQKLSFHQNKKDLLYISISAVAMGASWMFLYEAYTQIGVSLASLSYYCGPVIVMILSPFIFKEKLIFSKVFGFLAVVIGILLVNGSNSEGNISHWGIFCGLMSAVTYSLMVISNKKSKKVQGLENSMLQLFISFITVAVFVGLKTNWKIEVGSHDIVWILILGILNTGIGCYLYFSSIGKLPVQTVSICGYIEPLSAVIFAAALLGERMTAIQLVGAALIIGGAIFGECYKEKAVLHSKPAK